MFTAWKQGHIEAEPKWQPVWRWHFQIRFLQGNLLYFLFKFHSNMFPWSNWSFDIIGLEDVFALKRRQAITWTNDVLVCWRIYASLCLSEIYIYIWMSLDFIGDQSTLVKVMAWCRQATSHYLNQCWPTLPEPVLTNMIFTNETSKMIWLTFCI